MFSSKTHLPTHLHGPILTTKRYESFYTLPEITASYLCKTNQYFPIFTGFYPARLPHNRFSGGSNPSRPIKKNAAMLFFKVIRLRFFIFRTIHGSTDCVSTPGVFCIAGCRSLKSCSAGRDLLQLQPLQHRCQDST